MNIYIPDIDIPKIDIPKIDIPNIDIPKIDIPRIYIPKIDIPKIDIPRIYIPDIENPKSDIPNFSIDNSIILEITNIIDENDGLFHQLTLGGESLVMLGDSSINNDNNNTNSNTEALTLNDETVENTVLLSGGVAQENSLQSSSNHQTSSLPNPSDPLFSLQWHLLNPSTTGTWGINALDVWQDYTGKGVSVSVIDSGVDPNHPDLQNNYDYDNQFDAQTGQQGVVTLEDGTTINSGAPKTGDSHGTGVAGLIAAERNDVGVVGVAYDSTIVPIYASTENGINFLNLPSFIANSFAHAAKFDVSNNSWGYSNLFLFTPNAAFIDNFQNAEWAAAATELEQAVENGRDGLGTIFVQSAGNSAEYGDDVNLHNFQNSRYNLTVAATLRTGEIADYSSPGAAVTVSAPSSDAASPNLITTDIVGADGYSPLGDYALFNGTSGSAPIVSAVTALMLEANPDLGWRDVQEILFYSAVNSNRFSPSWQTNGANNWNGGGLTVSHDFGAGLVDAHGAVRLAETWQTQSTSANEDVVIVSSTDSSPIVIPDNDSTGISSSVMVDAALDIDYVELELDIDHNFIGDLEVTLTSPDGTVSNLVNRPGLGLLSDVGSNQDDIKFVFGSTQHWGETGEGEWTVRVKDLKTGDFGQLNNYTLSLYGDDINGNDTYIYTNEFAFLGSIPTRQILTDDTGVDTINTAAVTTDSLINLNPNSLSRIAGINTQIAVDTTIENAFTGDGNDTLTGNSSDNILMGGRGEDILTGGGGADTFVFNSLTEGIDVITDFDRADNDIIQIDSGRFGSLSLEQFSFDSTTGSLSFEGQEFVTLENRDNNNGFIVAQDVVIV